MFRLLWRFVRAILILIAIVLAIPLLGLAYGFATTTALDPAPLIGAGEGIHREAARQIREEIEGYQRPEESTFLTYPEWAIVYAAREYADFVSTHSPSDFPYWAYIGRFWQDHAAMARAARAYPFNFDNHLMLIVIGTSHKIEHAIQWAYENTLGRLSGLAGEPVGEDGYQAVFAAEYARFLDQVPWYRFPYAARRAGLWQTATASGAAAIRSWERKLAFGLSYTIKQAYADLIAAGLSATSDPALLDIHVWASGPVASAVSGEADTMLEKDLGERGAVFVTRRYQVFTDMIPRLIERGISFVEIGGNDEILVTMLSRNELYPPAGSRVIFGYQLAAEPTVRRTGLVVAVPALHAVLPALEEQQARLEHVYDY